MDVTNNYLISNPQQVQKFLSKWFIEKSLNQILFKEVLNPQMDEESRYLVEYEAIFEPVSLEQAYLELWVTADGKVSVGFETFDRIAKRLKVKNHKKQFASGHEPCELTLLGLKTLLDSVANGEIFISPFVFPGIGLLSTKAIIYLKSFNKLVLNEYTSVDWLYIKKTEFFAFMKNNSNLLYFNTWNSK